MLLNIRVWLFETPSPPGRKGNAFTRWFARNYTNAKLADYNKTNAKKFLMTLLENKKAYFDYEILEKFEAGLELRGGEVKSLRLKQGSLAGSRVIIRGGEAFLVGMSIVPYQPNNISGSPKEGEEQRTVKLLLTKREIDYLSGKAEERGLTITPLKLYNLGKKIKAEIALVRGKKKHEKREKIKKRETERMIRREFF